MDRSAYRDDNGTDQPDTYWRRRAVVLSLFSSRSSYPASQVRTFKLTP